MNVTETLADQLDDLGGVFVRVLPWVSVKFSEVVFDRVTSIVGSAEKVMVCERRCCDGEWLTDIECCSESKDLDDDAVCSRVLVLWDCDMTRVVDAVVVIVSHQDCVDVLVRVGITLIDIVFEMVHDVSWLLIVDESLTDGVDVVEIVAVKDPVRRG